MVYGLLTTFSFCGAIEIAGVITIKFDVIKDGQAKLGMKGGKSPIYIPGPVQPQFSPGRMIYFGKPKSLVVEFVC